MDREIILMPTKVDEKGVVHLVPMLKSEVDNGQLEQLVKMGIFAKEILEVKEVK